MFRTILLKRMITTKPRYGTSLGWNIFEKKKEFANNDPNVFLAGIYHPYYYYYPLAVYVFRE